MTKKLCDLKRLLKDDPEAYFVYVEAPTHICRSCGRAANDRDRLCKPKRMRANPVSSNPPQAAAFVSDSSIDNG